MINLSSFKSMNWSLFTQSTSQCLDVHWPVCLYVFLSIHLSTCSLIYLSFHLFVCLSVLRSVHVAIHQFVWPSIWPSFHPSICLSALHRGLLLTVTSDCSCLLCVYHCSGRRVFVRVHENYEIWPYAGPDPNPRHQQSNLDEQSNRAYFQNALLWCRQQNEDFRCLQGNPEHSRFVFKNTNSIGSFIKSFLMWKLCWICWRHPAHGSDMNIFLSHYSLSIKVVKGTLQQWVGSTRD